MRVLVTGHLGYVGSILTPMLRAAGHAVSGLDTNLYAASSFGPQPAAVPAIDRDIRDVERRDVRGFDAVIHLAGLSNDPLGDLDPRLTFAINHAAAVRLAEICREEGVARFVAASSCSVYGAAGDDWIDESASFNPVTPYAESKVLMEQDIGVLADGAFTPVFLRAATVYGHSPRIRFDLVINNLTAWAHATGEVLLKSDGMAWRPVLHVEDMARAFLAALEAPAERVGNRAFNVGATRDNYRIHELARIIHDIIPASRLASVDAPLHDPRNYRVDCDAISAAMPAARTRWSVADGVRELYRAFKAFHPTPGEFEGVRYQRVAQLLHLMASDRLGADLRWRHARCP